MDLQSSMTHGARDLDMEVFQKKKFRLDICRGNPKDVLHNVCHEGYGGYGGYWPEDMHCCM